MRKIKVHQRLLYNSIAMGWIGVSITPFFDSVTVTAEYDLTKHQLGFPLPIIEQHTSLTPLNDAFPFQLGMVNPHENPTSLLIGNYSLQVILASITFYILIMIFVNLNKLRMGYWEARNLSANHLAEKFRDFAINECRNSSPLYEFLAMKIAEDEEVLSLASKARDGQPIPNLLFGAVHYLLLKGNEHELREFYPSLVKNPRKFEDSINYFRDFCVQKSNEINEILTNKIVQTNEVRRCSYLYPAFSYIYRKTQKPLALIEIGTSAGLQLFVEKYRYSYGTERNYGSEDSGVHISAEIRGKHNPLDQLSKFKVASRVGIDLHLNDVSNDEDFLWLKALIWPEHQERRELFETAACYVRNNPLKLIEGDGVELLQSFSKDIPDDQIICVFHTHVANQMPIETKERLLLNIKNIGEKRDIFHLYNNIQDRDLHLDSYLNGNESLNKIAETEGHGRWFTWLMPD